MPTRAGADRIRKLTWRQNRELLLGPQVHCVDGQDGYPSAFASEQQRARAWQTHRERLLALLPVPFGAVLYEDAAGSRSVQRAAAATAHFVGDTSPEVFG